MKDKPQAERQRDCFRCFEEAKGHLAAENIPAAKQKIIESLQNDPTFCIARYELLKIMFHHEDDCKSAFT